MDTLHKIEVPALGQNFGSNIKETFDNIDSNFGALANTDLYKGDSGKGLISLQAPLYELMSIGKESEDGRHIRYFELGDYKIRTQRPFIIAAINKMASALGASDVDVESIVTQLSASSQTVLICIPEPQDDTIISEVVGGMPYIISDKRFVDVNAIVEEDLGGRVDMSGCLSIVSNIYSGFDTDRVMIGTEWCAKSCFPSLYYISEDQATEEAPAGLYWRINGDKTYIRASGPRGAAGKNGSVVIARFHWEDYLDALVADPGDESGPYATYDEQTGEYTVYKYVDEPVKISEIYSPHQVQEGSTTYWEYWVDANFNNASVGNNVMLYPDNREINEDHFQYYISNVFARDDNYPYAMVGPNFTYNVEWGKDAFKMCLDNIGVGLDFIKGLYVPFVGHEIPEEQREDPSYYVYKWLIKTDYLGNARICAVDNYNQEVDYPLTIKSTTFKVDSTEETTKLSSTSTTSNMYEVAVGKHNKSHHSSAEFGTPGNTSFSIGIGQDGQNQCNAIEVMQDGQIFVKGIGNYDGSNINGVDSIQAALQPKLIGEGVGQNIKTINGASIVGEGNLNVSSSGVSFNIEQVKKRATLDDQRPYNDVMSQDAVTRELDLLSDRIDQKQDILTIDPQPTEGSDNPVSSNGVYESLTKKQDTLIDRGGEEAGQNLKTINNQSLLGSGNLVITAENAAFVYGGGEDIPHGISTARLNFSTSVAMGEFSVAEGYNNEAQGPYSHAEGFGTRVEVGASYSHAEGYNTNISAPYAHSEGDGTVVEGTRAHAEGQASRASGNSSHAEGRNTIVATGAEAAHAEGYGSHANGPRSHAEGSETEANGNYSHSEGCETNARGESSHAEGFGSIAEGRFSHAEGNSNTGSAADYAHAEGKDALASGVMSHAEGSQTVAMGTASHAEGIGTTASNNYSHAEGQNTIAQGIGSHAEGFETLTNRDFSHAEGRGTSTYGVAQHAMGSYNKIYEGSYVYDVTGDAFIIGNGTSNINRNNSVRMTFDGKIYASDFISSGADYGEYFEWYDGNPKKEDRIGKFVSLGSNGKIRIAFPGDDVIGVISGVSTVIGNAAEEHWDGKYLKDIYGRPILETVKDEYETVNAKGKVIKKKVKTQRFKLNPKFDPERKYVPRSQRPEWDVVGLMGQLVVIDDGHCEVGKRCSCGAKGIAVPGSDYRVIKRLDENHILILASFL